MRSPMILCLFSGLVAVVSSSALASEPGLRVLARLPAEIHGDEAAWLEKLSHAAGSPVHFAAAVSRQRVAYQIDCSREEGDCEAALSRLQSSGLLEEIQMDTRKLQPRKPSTTTLP